MPIQGSATRCSTPNGSTTSIDSLVFTLDPKDKYVPLGVRRAATTSAIKQRKARLLGRREQDVAGASFYQVKGDESSETSTPDNEGPSGFRKRSIQSVFSKLRRTRSAESSVKTSSTSRTASAWSRKIFSSAGKSRKGEVAEIVPEVPKIPDDVLAMASCKPRSRDESPISHISKEINQIEVSLSRPPTPKESKATTQIPLLSLEQIRSTLPLPRGEDGDLCRRPISSRGSKASYAPSFIPSPRPGPAAIVSSNSAVTSSDKLPCSTSPTLLSRADRKIGQPEESPYSRNVDDESNSLVWRLGHQTLAPESEYHATSYAESTAFSFATSERLSPCLASNTTVSGQMSPLHLSQPDTPHLDDFNEDAVAWHRESETDLDRFYNSHSYYVEEDYHPPPPALPPPPPPGPLGGTKKPAHTTSSGFQGYSLPTHEQASSATLKKPPSLDLNQNPSHRASTQHLVQSWDDGIEHRISSLTELMDDLGYLGNLIN